MENVNNHQDLHLAIIEKSLKENRDFNGLIQFYHNIVENDNSLENLVKILPKKAYCLIRVGKENEAKDIFNLLKDKASYGEPNKILEAFTLFSFFINKDVNLFGKPEVDYMKYLLNDPRLSEQFVDIVFDYPDIIGKVPHFSEELLKLVFNSMVINIQGKIYYNRSTKGVQLEKSGFLFNLRDFKEENLLKLIRNKIVNNDAEEEIKEGIHYLIPRLLFSDFLNIIYDLCEDFPELQYFIEEFESAVTDEFEDSSTLTNYDSVILKRFINELRTVAYDYDIGGSLIDKKIQMTKKLIASNFLNSIHNNTNL